MAYKISLDWLLKGAVIGGVLSVTLALYQYDALDSERVGGHYHPIYFGFVCSIQGILAMVAVLKFKSEQKGWALLAVIAAIAAFTAMILSVHVAHGKYFAITILIWLLYKQQFSLKVVSTLIVSGIMDVGV